MIIEVQKDLLTSEADIIAHQTNCVGIMGAGVAKQIKYVLLGKDAFRQYKELCRQKKKSLLGTVQYLPTMDERIVANLFGENIPTGIGVDTDYEALKSALDKLKTYAEEQDKSIALPGYLGCGLAGGDWEIVFEMIYEIFKDSPVKVEICYLPI